MEGMGAPARGTPGDRRGILSGMFLLSVMAAVIDPPAGSAAGAPPPYALTWPGVVFYLPFVFVLLAHWGIADRVRDRLWDGALGRMAVVAAGYGVALWLQGRREGFFAQPAGAASVWTNPEAWVPALPLVYFLYDMVRWTMNHVHRKAWVEGLLCAVTGAASVVFLLLWFDVVRFSGLHVQVAEGKAIQRGAIGPVDWLLIPLNAVLAWPLVLEVRRREWWGVALLLAVLGLLTWFAWPVYTFAWRKVTGTP
jgi:hypothetical protein